MPVNIGDRIRDARKSAGLTQKQLADMIGVSNTSISNWETGLSRPDPDAIQYLCWALKVDPNFFFNETIQTSLVPVAVEDKNIIRIAARDGSYVERFLSDQQLAALKAVLDQMPDVPDDL